MRVEWKEGRRALVVLFDGVAFSAVAEVGGDGEALWVPEFDPMGVLWEPVLDSECSTRLLPSQCPRCFEVDDHEQGCMVDANLARGVPPFWAPWAMGAPPDYKPDDCTVMELWDDGLPQDACWHEGEWVPAACGADWPLWVAIGPDGPTLEPWGQS